MKVGNGHAVHESRSWTACAFPACKYFGFWLFFKCTYNKVYPGPELYVRFQLVNLFCDVFQTYNEFSTLSVLICDLFDNENYHLQRMKRHCFFLNVWFAFASFFLQFFSLWMGLNLLGLENCVTVAASEQFRHMMCWKMQHTFWHVKHGIVFL